MFYDAVLVIVILIAQNWRMFHCSLVAKLIVMPGYEIVFGFLVDQESKLCEEIAAECKKLGSSWDMQLNAKISDCW